LFIFVRVFDNRFSYFFLPCFLLPERSDGRSCQGWNFRQFVTRHCPASRTGEEPKLNVTWFYLQYVFHHVHI
jgi:hypothetical protein